MRTCAVAAGAPECGDLADALADAGVEGFGADAVRVTTAHARRVRAVRRASAAAPRPDARSSPPSPWSPRRSCSSSAPRTRSWPTVCRSVGSHAVGRGAHAPSRRGCGPWARSPSRCSPVPAASIVVLVLALAVGLSRSPTSLDHGTVDGRPRGTRSAPVHHRDAHDHDHRRRRRSRPSRPTAAPRSRSADLARRLEDPAPPVGDGGDGNRRRDPPAPPPAIGAAVDLARRPPRRPGCARTPRC